MADGENLKIEIGYNSVLIRDLEDSKTSLLSIETTRASHIDKALLRDAIISYMRPFMSSVLGKGKKVVHMKKEDLPTDLRDLHSEIHNLRDKVVAHADMDWKQLSSSFSNIGAGLNFRTEFLGLDYKYWFEKTDEFLKLIEASQKSLTKKTVSIVTEIQALEDVKLTDETKKTI